MTVHQLIGKQEPGKRVTGLVATEKIAPISRAALSGSQPGDQLVSHRGKSRRELLIYAWAGTLAALTVGSGVAAYQFLYPRQPINEFGGKFLLGAAANLPPVGIEPQLNIEGRFWLANYEDGPRALYEICTHPWRGTPHKYRWDSARSRFECPWCGSKFSREGLYIEGPAPRNLDQFVVEIKSGREVLARTKRSHAMINAPSLPFPGVDIIVDTGMLIEGLPSGVGP